MELELFARTEKQERTGAKEAVNSNQGSCEVKDMSSFGWLSVFFLTFDYH